MQGLHLGQRVTVDGMQGVFDVVGLDAIAQLADLQWTTGSCSIAKNIPFASIHPVLKEDVDVTGRPTQGSWGR